jgi:predicted membrane GTPase involved in stress response
MMNIQLQASAVAASTNVAALTQPVQRKTVVRAAKGELVLFAGYDSMALSRTLCEADVIELMGSPAVSH